MKNYGSAGGLARFGRAGEIQAGKSARAPCPTYIKRPKCDWIDMSEIGAGDGNRTRVASLEGWNSTIELHPQLLSTLPAPRWLSILCPQKSSDQPSA
jgi:hypothetical protein